MPEELGKIEKPSVQDFAKGRKLFFIPLIYIGKESPIEYLEKYNKYWDQVEAQVIELELKMGKATRIYHEFVTVSGEEGAKATKDLNEDSYRIIRYRAEKGAQVEATEDVDILTEFMDWGRCLAIGLQNHKVLTKVYEFYQEAGKKRNEYIAKHLNETLKEDEIGLLFLQEGHKVQVPPDIQLFYVSPPALDEIYRWLREIESKPEEKEQK